jgi:formyltetrahydrofolate synthetase
MYVTMERCSSSGFELRIISLIWNFKVAQCGNIMTMPGLPREPAAQNIGVQDGDICGLF